jgi:protoporphyrinogen oxidase
MKKNVVIIGGGTAGIISGLCLIEDFNVTIIDNSSEPGGLLRSELYSGIEFDFGTHFIMETLDKDIDNLLFDFIDDNWTRLPYLKAGNFFNGKLNEHSPSMDLRTLDKNSYNQCISELFQEKKEISASNLDIQLVNTFGKTITKKVYEPILKKYYQTDLDKLSLNSHSLASSRVIVLDSARTKELKKIERFDTLISFHTFKERVSIANSFYPKKSGIGLWLKTLYKKFELKGGKIINNAYMESLSFRSQNINSICLQDHQNLDCDKVVSTISPIFLLNTAKVDLPKNLSKPKSVNTVLLHMGFDKKFLTELYYLNCFDPDMITFRVTLYSNFREVLFNNDKKYLTVECFLDSNNYQNNEIISIVKDELKNMSIIDKKNKCTFSKLIRLKNGFPIPTLEFKDSSSRLLSEAKSKFENVSFLGRGAGESFYLQDVIKNSFYEMQKVKEDLF